MFSIIYLKVKGSIYVWELILELYSVLYSMFFILPILHKIHTFVLSDDGKSKKLLVTMYSLICDIYIYIYR